MVEVETTEDNDEHKDHQAESSIVKTASSEQSEISGKKLNPGSSQNILYANLARIFMIPKKWHITLYPEFNQIIILLAPLLIY